MIRGAELRVKLAALRSQPNGMSASSSWQVLAAVALRCLYAVNVNCG
jgi:hypothetical protein